MNCVHKKKSEDIHQVIGKITLILLFANMCSMLFLGICYPKTPSTTTHKTVVHHIERTRLSK